MFDNCPAPGTLVVCYRLKYVSSFQLTEELPELLTKMTSSQTQASSKGSWLRVAALMGSKPELAILRKFSKLNALRLLEMQSELIDQEEEFEFICSLDGNEECPITKSYQTNWEALNDSQGVGGSQQRDTWRKLRGSLEAYSKWHGSRSILHYFH